MRICDVCFFGPLASLTHVKSTRRGVLLLITLLKRMLFPPQVNNVSPPLCIVHQKNVYERVKTMGLYSDFSGIYQQIMAPLKPLPCYSNSCCIKAFHTIPVTFCSKFLTTVKMPHHVEIDKIER